MESIITIEGMLSAKLHQKMTKKIAEEIVRYLCSLEELQYWLFGGWNFEIDSEIEETYGEIIDKEKGIQSFLKNFSVEKKQMSFRVNNWDTSFKVNFEESEIMFTCKTSIIEQKYLGLLITVFWEIINLLKDQAHLIYSPGIKSIADFEYTKRQPRQDPNFFGFEQFVSFFDTKYFQDDEEGKLTKQLVTATLSSKQFRVEEREDSRFVMIAWEDTVDVENIKKGLEAKEDFIAEHCPEVPLDTDFNTLGDLRVFAGDLAVERLGSDNFFSNYHVHYHIAFKAYMPPYPDKIEEETKKELLHFSNSKSLENGKEIKRIMLIVPIRDLAISLEEDAKKCGVDKLLYVDDLGFFWDLHPDGKWKKVV